MIEVFKGWYWFQKIVMASVIIIIHFKSEHLFLFISKVWFVHIMEIVDVVCSVLCHASVGMPEGQVG